MRISKKRLIQIAEEEVRAYQKETTPKPQGSTKIKVSRENLMKMIDEEIASYKPTPQTKQPDDFYSSIGNNTPNSSILFL